jgi:hypothetical protein
VLTSAEEYLYGRYNDLICIYKLSLSQMLSAIFSYQQLSCFWHTYLDGGSPHIHDQETGLMVGVTNQQGMLTPPKHLIPPPFGRRSLFAYLFL